MARAVVPRPMTLSVEVYRQIAKEYKIQHGIDIRINGGDDNPILQQAQREWLQEESKDLQGDETEISNALRQLTIKSQTVGLALGQAAQTIIDLMPQAVTPIAFLRPSLEKRVIGVTTGPSHMAGFIITQQLVIGIARDEPEIYVAAAICPSLRYAETNLSSFILEPKKEVAAQTDSSSCGSLAISLLKELLKKNAHQLLHDCLIISKAEHKDPSQDPIVDQFLPSPQSLRYSQSTLFIKVARAIVAGMEPEVDVHHRGQTYRVRTLTGLQALGSPMTMVDGRQADVSDFRARWLQQFDEVAMPARRAMQSGPEDGGRNLYLNHVVHRHARRFKLAGGALG